MLLSNAGTRTAYSDCVWQTFKAVECLNKSRKNRMLSQASHLVLILLECAQHLMKHDTSVYTYYFHVLL